MVTEEEIEQARQEMEAYWERGIRDAAISRGVQGNHRTTTDCWCEPRIIKTPYGTIIVHRRPN